MDIVVVGGGVSAVLLAESLAALRCFRTLRIVAPDRPLRAHRLSYWSDVPTPFDAYADASWQKVRVVGPEGIDATVSLQRNVYRSMRAHDWHAAAKRRLAEVPGVEWIDARADRLGTSGARGIAHVDGAELEADWVFSSTRMPGVDPDCRQRFEGWELTVAEDAFDPTVATLLDFRTPAAEDFRFIYALPLGPRRLFIEHVGYRPSDHAPLIEAYLREVIGLNAWDVVDREYGATPIFRDAPERRIGRVVHIGVDAGLAKPATGYALTRMWRDAERVATSLAEHGTAPAAARPSWLYRVADHLFVDQVQEAPTRLVELVHALFRGASGDSILAFLDDRARRSEQLEVALTTPRWVRWWMRRG